MLPISQRLIERLRCADPTAQVLCEAQAEIRSDILKTRSDFESADTFVQRSADFTLNNALVASGQSTFVTLSSAPSANHLYEVHFRTSITPTVPGSGVNNVKLVVVVETDPTNSGTYTEQVEVVYPLTKKPGEPGGAQVWDHERIAVRVPGFNASGRIRLRVKSASGSLSFSVHGFNSTQDMMTGSPPVLTPVNGVRYHTGPVVDFLDAGQGVTLADVTLSKISYGISDSYETDLGGPPLVKAESPYLVARVVWGKDDSADIAIHRIKAFLNPCVDGNSANKNVAYWKLQPFTLATIYADIGQFDEHVVFKPIADPVTLAVGDEIAAQTYSFTWVERTYTGPGHTQVTLNRRPHPKEHYIETMRDAEVFRPEYEGGVTYIFIWGLQADGSTKATNIGWGRNSAVTAEVQNGSRQLRTVRVQSLQAGSWLVESPEILAAPPRPQFRVDVQCGSYASANLEFTGAGALNLGATPTATVEFVAVSSNPVGTSSIFEVRNDADTAWLPFTDGQTAAEVGVSQRQNYKVRWRALTNIQGDATPTLWEIGVRDVTRVWLSDIVRDVRARWEVSDVGNLTPAIPEAEIVVLKNGEADFGDRITKLLADYHIGTLSFRVWVGDPTRSRSEWLHKDDFVLVDDYDPRASEVTLIAHSPLVLLNGALPVYNTTTQKRAALELANLTPTQVWNEVVGVHLAPDVPNRYRGDVAALGEAQILAKTIEDSDGLTELNAVAQIAGCVLSSARGRITAFDMFTPSAVLVSFPSAKVRWRATPPGLRQRVPLFFVKYGFDNEDGTYAGEARVVAGSGATLTNLQMARIDARQSLDDTVCQWIPTEQQARALGKRRVESLGTGMLRWSFTSVDPYPELQLGDLVAVETTQFMQRDPTQATQRLLFGQLWAVGRIVSHDIEGRDFEVWIQTPQDILGAGEAADRLGFAKPLILGIDLTVSGAGVVSSIIRTQEAGSVRVAVSTSGFPTEATVRGQAAQTLDAAGQLVTASLGTIATGQVLYVSAFAYETTLGSGTESPLAQASTAPYAPPPDPNSVQSVLPYFRANKLYVAVEGNSGVLSFKVAESSASFPAAGTGTLYAGNSGLHAGSVYTYAQTAFITVTPYSGASGGGVAGVAYRTRIKLMADDLLWDEPTGKKKRGAPYFEGGYPFNSSTSDGLTADSSGKESGGKALNRLLAKTGPTDADSFDGVPAGTYLQSTGVKHAATIAGLPAQVVAKVGHGVFLETFEDLAVGWVDNTGLATQALVSGAGQTGGKVHQSTNKCWLVFPALIPFDPSKLYRIRVRVRRTVTTDASHHVFYCGLECYAADGVTKVNTAGLDQFGSQHYVCASNKTLTAYAIDQWVEFTGWFKGHAATGQYDGGTPVAPSALHDNVRYFKPMFITNYDTGTTNVTQVDYLAIDVHDEEEAKRAYEVLDASGSIALVPAASIREGSATFKIYHHREEITVNGPDTDGDVPVTFGATYQNAPQVLLRGGQYVCFSNVIGTSVKQRQRIQPLDVATSGFKSRAQICSVGTTTAQTDTFATASLSGSRTSPGALSGIGTTSEADLTPGGANDDTYTVHFTVDAECEHVNNSAHFLSLVVAIDSNDGSTWIERATRSYSIGASSGPLSGISQTEHVAITVTGMGVNDDVRVRIKDAQLTGNGGALLSQSAPTDAEPRIIYLSGSYTVTLTNVTYTTASDTTESAIPAAGDSVTWVAQEVS